MEKTKGMNYNNVVKNILVKTVHLKTV